MKLKRQRKYLTIVAPQSRDIFSLFQRRSKDDKKNDDSQQIDADAGRGGQRCGSIAMWSSVGSPTGKPNKTTIRRPQLVKWTLWFIDETSCHFKTCNHLTVVQSWALLAHRDEHKFEHAHFVIKLQRKLKILMNTPCLRVVKRQSNCVLLVK